MIARHGCNVAEELHCFYDAAAGKATGMMAIPARREAFGTNDAELGL